MLISDRHYPHPVLSFFSDDYHDKVFQSSLDVRPTKTFYKLVVKSNTSSKSLRELIAQKIASYCIHVECPSTRYRDCFTFYDSDFEVDIPVSDLEGKVEVSKFLVCVSPKANYSSDEFHTDFSGRSFDLEKGDVLAVAPTTEFIASKKRDELATVPSIFSIVASDEDDAPPIDVHLMNQKIKVVLSSSLHRKFVDLNSSNDARACLTTMVLIPSIVFTLSKLRSSEQLTGFTDQRWFDVFRRRFALLDIDIMSLDEHPDSDLVLAGRLLGDPLIEAIEDLNEILLSMSEGEDND